MLKFLILNFLLNSIFVCNIFANDNSDVSMFHKIARDNPYCIVEMDNNKCYLDSNCLVLDKGHLYVVDSSSNYIELSEIFTDEKGCYINNLNNNDELPSFGYGVCPSCNRFFFLIDYYKVLLPRFRIFCRKLSSKII